MHQNPLAQPEESLPGPWLDEAEKDWDDMGQESLESEQLLSQLSDEAQACRSSSDTESEPEAHAGEVPWWVKQLKEHTADCGFPIPTKKQVQVVSACTGASAESFVLKVRVRGLLKSM